MTEATESGEPIVANPAQVAARWLATASSRVLPDEIIEAARRTLIDWFACCVGALREPVVDIITRRVRAWSPSGEALLLTGGATAPAFAALVHSTAAHACDFDDTHIYTDAHFSGPTWAAVLAHDRESAPLDDSVMCQAYVAGFEAAAKLGGRRMGHAMSQRGFQPTGLLGRLSAAAACAVVQKLAEQQIALALSIAASQSAGLTASFGTMLKPFQGGKTALDGVLAAELAREHFDAPVSIFEKGGGLARALVQDGYAEIAVPDFGAGWEILRNSTKAYPCLHGIHSAIDAAREVHARLHGREIEHVRVFVGPAVPRIARFTRPSSPHEAKFSITYGVVLGLLGKTAAPHDYELGTLCSELVQGLLPRIEVVPTEGRKMIDACVEAKLTDGEILSVDVPLARGHPGRPLLEAELEAKFMSLVAPVLGRTSETLLGTLKMFPAGRAVHDSCALVRETLRL